MFHKRQITLLTDFGQSHYVGQMRGVIRSIAEDANIDDISHQIGPQSVLEGAFLLKSSYGEFPRGTIHIAVVDPNVGTDRAALAIETESYMFVGPDNGVLSWALKDETVLRTVSVDWQKVSSLCKRERLSKTFHARDVFAPCAALLCRGVDIDSLGARKGDIIELDDKMPLIVHIDRFGNIIANIRRDIKRGQKVHVLHQGKRHLATCVDTFSQAEPGSLIVLSASHGLLEVDISMGNAADSLKAKVGDYLGVEDAV